MDQTSLRTLQRPLKDRYRQEPGSALIELRATGGQTDSPLTCSVDIGRAIYAASAHQGVGGAGMALPRCRKLMRPRERS